MKFKVLTAVVTSFIFSSCVRYYSMPDGYTGPTAKIVNRGEAHDAFKSSVFRVEEIDGKLVASSPMQTRQGGGPVVRMGESSVTVPAGSPITVKLGAGDQFAADGPALIYSLGGKVSKSASETFTFTPKPDATYLVDGRLGKDASSVWMKDQESGRRFP